MEITPQQIEQTADFSNNNLLLLSKAKSCGCYYCLKVFSPEEIKQYTANGSAICPYCDVDSILPDNCGISLTLENLQKLYKHWFAKTFLVAQDE